MNEQWDRFISIALKVWFWSIAVPVMIMVPIAAWGILYGILTGDFSLWLK